MQGKEVVTVRLQKGMYTIRDQEDEMYLVVMIYSLCNSWMFSNCCRTNHVRENKVGNLGN